MLGISNATRRLMLVLVIFLAAPPLFAQQLWWTEPSGVVGASQRVLMDQIQDLTRAGENTEALAVVERLYDQGHGLLVEHEQRGESNTLQVRYFQPLRDWCAERREEIVASGGNLLAEYVSDRNAKAAVALQVQLEEKNLLETSRLAERYRRSASGRSLALLLADLYLEENRPLDACAVLERAFWELDWRGERGEHGFTRAYRLADESQRRAMVSAWKSSVDSTSPEVQGEFHQALHRLLIAATMAPDLIDVSAMADFVQFSSEQLLGEQVSSEQVSSEQVSSEQRATSIWDASRTWGTPTTPIQWSTFAGNRRRYEATQYRFDLSQWPNWSHRLERFFPTSEASWQTRPRVGELKNSALPFHPVVHDGVVHVNMLCQIKSFELSSGRPWPNARVPTPLFDSGVSAAAYIPLGYPQLGVPRGTLELSGDYLFARMGSPITGWVNRDRNSGEPSLSYLVGLDLKRQGRLLRGFPLFLESESLAGYEFEGCPVAWRDLILVAICERDNVALRRGVAAFDRVSGALRWEVKDLIAGSIDGSERANLISHQLLTLAGGRLYYNTNLGAIACLDPVDGSVHWCTSYRQQKGESVYHEPRFRFRDLTPCVVDRGLLICMPQDCGEVFALEPTSGKLVWSTDNVVASDANQILGVTDDCVVVSGDRLIWLDRNTGRVVRSFPGATTPGRLNALPSPRGLGRGLLSGGQVYWPTAGEVFVFSAHESSSSAQEVPAIVHRYQLQNDGGRGGNLVTYQDWLLFCSTSQIIAFRGEVVGGD